MTTVMLCTDGSAAALGAIDAGLSLLHPTRTVLVTVIPAPDPSLVTGTGFAGGVMSPEEADRLRDSDERAAYALLDEAAQSLGLSEPEMIVRSGDPGPELCALAASLPADVLVLGTHGRSGVLRAVMGSISDHVVRHVGCPVLLRGPG